jgi:hypothetical protein
MSRNSSNRGDLFQAVRKPFHFNGLWLMIDRRGGPLKYAWHKRCYIRETTDVVSLVGLCGVRSTLASAAQKMRVACPHSWRRLTRALAPGTDTTKQIHDIRGLPTHCPRPALENVPGRAGAPRSVPRRDGGRDSSRVQQAERIQADGRFRRQVRHHFGSCLGQKDTPMARVAGRLGRSGRGISTLRS